MSRSLGKMAQFMLIKTRKSTADFTIQVISEYADNRIVKSGKKSQCMRSLELLREWFDMRNHLTHISHKAKKEFQNEENSR